MQLKFLGRGYMLEADSKKFLSIRSLPLRVCWYARKLKVMWKSSTSGLGKSRGCCGFKQGVKGRFHWEDDIFREHLRASAMQP